MNQASARRRWREVNGIVLLDKPYGLSSNQALQQVRRLFRAAKAGHTGALDPLATGLLPLCFGQATKLSADLLDGDKRYLATVQLGARTSSGDAEGEVIARSAPHTLDGAEIETALRRFTGVQQQVPPMHSALKVQGRPLYERARAGETVERAPRTVTIYELRLLERLPDRLVLDVLCSKGTYIRTLAEDLGAALGQCAHLGGLRRTGAAPFAAADMLTWELLEAAAEQGDEALLALLRPPSCAVAHWPKITVDGAQAQALSRGRQLAIDGAPAAGKIAVLSPDGALLGLARIDEHGRVAPFRWLGSAG